MHKLLRRRIFRDLRENMFRYLALGFLVILGMYMVIRLVGAADTIIIGTADAAEENRIEDGQFRLFVPLTEGERSALEEEGVTLEAHFYLDYTMEDDSVLRVFSERKEIDLPQADFGRMPQKTGEIFLEKRYCEEHGISVDDEITVGGHFFRVCGIGTSPDYDTPYRNLSDSAVDSDLFGVGFLTEGDYESFRKEKKSGHSEEYIYAYLLDGKLSEKELKERLQELDLEAEDIDDSYFQEYWEQRGGRLADFRQALEDLAAGAEELQEGLAALNRSGGKLTEGATGIFDTFLAQASESLSEFGVTELTRDNYKGVLKGLIAGSESAIMRLSLKSLLEQLNDLAAFEKGMGEYTEGVSGAAEGAGKMTDGISEFSRETRDFLEERYDTRLSKLTQFLPADSNGRIGGAADDKFVDKAAGLAAGIIVLILFAYVISVFVVHSIGKEAGMIGTLYALGVRRNELLRHYLALPVLITLLAGIIGTAFGYSALGVKMQMRECYEYFSIPALKPIYEPYLLLYGICLPPVLAVVTNFLVIRKKLGQPALSLIRNKKKQGKMQNIRLHSGNFVYIFQVRQLLREKRTAFTVFFGMFISLLVVMLSLNCYVLCNHIKAESHADTEFAYMYTYKYPEEKVPEGGEAAYGITFKKEVLGYNLDVTLLGVDRDNPYFNIVKDGNTTFHGKNIVQISSAMAKKYQLDVGDDLVLKDEGNDRNYAFTVEAVVPCSTSFFAFMNIDSMRELMGEDSDYYNIVFAGHALAIDRGRLYSSISKDEIEKSSSVFVEKMMPMVSTLMIASALIFAVVLYLMMRVMVDRQTMSISLMKIFGYRNGEIRKLYLNGNLGIIVASALIGIPLSKWIMDRMYPYLVSNIACGMNLTFSWQIYAGLLGGILLLYFMINGILMRYVGKILPAEVLKDRE